MRIIVTKNGKIILKELENEKNIASNEDDIVQKKKYRNFSGLKLPLLNKDFSSLKSFYEHKKKLKWGQKPRTKSVFARRTMDNFFNRDESKINKNEINMMIQMLDLKIKLII